VPRRLLRFFVINRAEKGEAFLGFRAQGVPRLRVGGCCTFREGRFGG
jgi:hypothetical protein